MAALVKPQVLVYSLRHLVVRPMLVHVDYVLPQTLPFSVLNLLYIYRERTVSRIFTLEANYP